LALCAIVAAQPNVSNSTPPSAQPGNPPDILGRTTPRGTVLGFLKAASEGDDETAAEYLNTPLRGKAAAVLAHQLFVVLDRRLPARLNELSDRPEGSLAFLTRPDQDLVGTITDGSDTTDIMVERVTRAKSGSVWLFSKKTLDSIPELFSEADALSVESVLPQFLVRTRIAQVALGEWLGILLGLPLLYLITGLLSRGVRLLTGRLRGRLSRNGRLSEPVYLSRPVRLLIVALVVRWVLSEVSLPLLARQLWSATATTIIIASCAWVLILLNGRAEDLVLRRLERVNKTGAKALLRLGRRTLDLIVLFVGALVLLQYFGVNPTAALAGLGVGGIAVALAAQRTLENVIGGISITFDKAVRVGDTLNIGTTTGVVEAVGLRSTRIRTLDRTLVSVPNGQLANVQLENLSARDQFWFHHNVSLRYETTAAIMQSVVAGISNLLMQHSYVDRESVRVRFFRFAASSLDIEAVAYVSARDYPHFLEIQEDLLLQVMAIVESSGAHRALQSYTMYLAGDSIADWDGAKTAAVSHTATRR
jgi:MscS family membrane protein